MRACGGRPPSSGGAGGPQRQLPETQRQPADGREVGGGRGRVGPKHVRPRQRDGERPQKCMPSPFLTPGSERTPPPGLTPGLFLQFMEDEEFVDTVKGFSTVRKEHTMFTDTNL